MVKSLHHFLIPSIITSIILSSPHQVEVGEQPSDSPALEMRSQEEMEEVEVNKEVVEEEEEGESVAVASVPSTSIKMPDLGPTSLAVNDICTSCIHRCRCHQLNQLNHQY